MGFLDDVLGKSVPQGNYAKPLLIALGALLASGMLHKKAATTPPPGQPTTPPSVPTGAAEGGLLGGLGGLLERFQQAGHGDVANSWVGTGPNQPISPNQLGTALGPNIIKSLAERTGMSEQELTAQLSQILPGVVDKLTPQGRLPTEAEIATKRG
jgi:uncharacterized protein YidB (DUF937 family)